MIDDRGATIARAFAAAREYDRHARVQRLVARALAARIAALPLPAAPRVLEIGCGTGFLAQALIEEGLGGDWLLTDVAPAMLDRARARLAHVPGGSPRLAFATLDGEHGDAPGGPFDLVCASLATQWFADEPAALARWRDTLSPRGHVVVSTLGPGTFAEWRAAHEAEGLSPGTLGFTSATDLAALGLAEPPVIERYRERHENARAFLHALRGIGAGTASAAHKPLSPSALRRVMRRFEDEGATVTYEVVTCRLATASESA